ncbi:MAG: methyltransferase domain-containing protein [Chloroflexi bacterium]|nr:methyltransferase domain-containing protein [Chloroflexota bacterium]
MQKVDYNEISQVYDDVREGDVALVNSFLHEISPSDDFKILDIGCGTGNYTDILQKLTGAQVYGIEPSKGMLDKAQQKNAHIVFRQGTAAGIPFEEAFFDFVYMTDVIHHVPDIAAMFAEIYRVLGAQGKVCIGTQSHAQIAARPTARFFPGTVRVDQERYPDIEEIVVAARGQGLEYIKQEILFKEHAVDLDKAYLELVRKKGYSMLHLISDDEYQAGLRALESALKDGPVHARMAGETLVWFKKVMSKEVK